MQQKLEKEVAGSDDGADYDHPDDDADFLLCCDAQEEDAHAEFEKEGGEEVPKFTDPPVLKNDQLPLLSCRCPTYHDCCRHIGQWDNVKCLFTHAPMNVYYTADAHSNVAELIRKSASVATPSSSLRVQLKRTVSIPAQQMQASHRYQSASPQSLLRRISGMRILLKVPETSQSQPGSQALDQVYPFPPSRSAVFITTLYRLSHELSLRRDAVVDAKRWYVG